MGIGDIETGGDIGAETADFAAQVHRRDRACPANPRECRTIHATGKSTQELENAWLPKEGSNHQMILENNPLKYRAFIGPNG